jgi:hypothetical protein
MSLYSDWEAEAHFMRPTSKKRCGFCVNCQSVKRWYDVYWKPFIESGGDVKWARKQISLDKRGLPCLRRDK